MDSLSVDDQSVDDQYVDDLSVDDLSVGDLSWVSTFWPQSATCMVAHASLAGALVEEPRSIRKVFGPKTPKKNVCYVLSVFCVRETGRGRLCGP